MAFAKIEMSADAKKSLAALNAFTVKVKTKMEEYRKAMSAGDIQAGANAVSARNDAATLERIVKRIESGFYN